MNEALLAALDLVNERLRQTEVALHGAEQSVGAATEAKCRLLNYLSQEIRTPMNGLLGMVEHVLQSTLNSDQRSHLQTVQDSAEDVLNIINDLLDHAKLEAGQLELHPQDFHLRRELDEVLRPLLVRAKKKGVNLTRYVAPVVPDALHADSQRLRQVLQYLVTHALKSTAKGTIHVTVDTVQESTDIETPNEFELRIIVSDSGAGIAPEIIPNIFSPFSPATDSQRLGNARLGLAISKQLVSLMGGKIQVRSQLGKGSEFSYTIRLHRALNQPSGSITAKPSPASPELSLGPNVPIKTSNKFRNQSPTYQRTEAPKSTAPFRKLRVLIADDHPVNREVAAVYLEKLGHAEPAFAENGRAALNQILQSEFDVVLMDVQMPVLDGLEATRELRRREDAAGAPRLPVIALTSHAGDSERAKCLEAGMDEFLTKPVRRAALAQALDSVLEKSAVTEPESKVERTLLTPQLRDLLRRTTDDGLARLRESLERRDVAAAARDAHFIKGGLSILDDPLPAATAAAIEGKLKKGDFDAAARLMEQLAESAYRSIEE